MAQYNLETTLDVFRAIRWLEAARPWPPTQQEIADEAGFSYRSAVRRHIRRLAKWGLITYEPGEVRSIRLTEDGQRFHVDP